MTLWTAWPIEPPGTWAVWGGQDPTLELGPVRSWR